MLRPLAALFLAAAVHAPAAAQTMPISDAQFGAELSAVLSRSALSAQVFGQALAQANKAQAADRVLESVMTAMYDAPGTGELVVQWLRDNNAVVALRDASGHAWLDAAQGRRPAVYIDAAMAQPPVSYRLIGARIAQEAASLMLADFPASAERTYMAASRKAETYFELGGTRLELDEIERADPEAVRGIRLWVENDPASGVRLLAGKGEKTLEQILRGLGSERQLLINHGMYEPAEELDEEIAAVQKGMAEFAAFKKYESDWLMAHIGMLQ